MEAMIWLLIKMGGLLAVAGFAFFGLGWWARGQRAVQNSPSPSSLPNTFSVEEAKLAASESAKISELEMEIAALKSERDHLLELRTNQAPPQVAEPSVTPPKRAAKARPRKSKK